MGGGHCDDRLSDGHVSKTCIRTLQFGYFRPWHDSFFQARKIADNYSTVPHLTRDINFKRSPNHPVKVKPADLLYGCCKKVYCKRSIRMSYIFWP